MVIRLGVPSFYEVTTIALFGGYLNGGDVGGADDHGMRNEDGLVR